jgi:hypothetical protein
MLRVSDFSISWYLKSRYDVPASGILAFHFSHFGTPDDEGSLSLHLPVTEILIFNILSDVPFRVFAFLHLGTPDVEGSLSLHLPVTEILIFNILSDAPFRVFAFRHFGTPDVGVLDISNSGIRNPGS